ncbi:MAG: restriction endonuclease subunit S [Candidatus Kryptoniota bacterium]
MESPSNVEHCLPNGWVRTTLGSVLSFVKGKKPLNLGSKLDNSFLPYVNIEAFEKKILSQYARADGHPTCNKDDVLIVWDGARCGLVGRGVDGIIGSTLAKLPYDEMDGSFIFYFLQSKYNLINKRPRGVGIPHVEPNLFWSIVFPLPPLPEQHRIVAKIEELFSDLDAGIEALKKVKAELKRYRQSVLKAAVEGKLTAPWREANKGKVEPAAVLLERIRAGRDSVRARHAVPQRQAKDLPPIDTSELPKLPEGWEWTRVGTVAETCLGKMLDKVKNKGEYQPYLRNINVRWGGFDLSDLSQMKFEQDEEQRYGLLHGDLVVCEGGEPGRAAVWTGTPGMKIQKALHRVRFVANTVTAEFLQSYLEHAAKNGILEKYFTGTTIKHFTGVRLAEFVLPLPPCQEQLQIVSEVERRLSAADEVGTYCDMSLRQAERLRQSILKRAFEGKLVPQDPTDEPASVLLENIKRKKIEEKAIKSSNKRGKK